LADDLTPSSKNLAQHTASDAVLTVVIGRLIGILEATNSDLTKELDEMFNVIIQQVNTTRDRLTQPPSGIEAYFLEQYSKGIDNIQSFRNSSRMEAESRLKEGSPPEA